MAQSPDVRDRTLAQPSAPLNDQPGTSAAPAAADPDRYSYQDFAAAVRRKYVTERGKDPYGDLADDQLVHAYLQRFPAYRAMVSDVMPEAGDVPGISSPVITPQPLGQMSDRARARLRAVEPPRLSPISHTPIPNPQTIEQGIEDDLTPAGAYAGPLGMIASMLSPRTKRLLQIPEQGITQAARGVGQMVEGQAKGNPTEQLQGIHDFAAGGMAAATPAIPAALVEAPLMTTAGIAAGTLTTEGIRKGGDYLGVPPPITDVLGDVGGILVGGAAAHVAGAPGRSLARFGQDVGDATTSALEYATADLARTQAKVQGPATGVYAEIARQGKERSLTGPLAGVAIPPPKVDPSLGHVRVPRPIRPTLTPPSRLLPEAAGPNAPGFVGPPPDAGLVDHVDPNVRMLAAPGNKDLAYTPFRDETQFPPPEPPPAPPEPPPILTPPPSGGGATQPPLMGGMRGVGKKGRRGLTMRTMPGAAGQLPPVGLTDLGQQPSLPIDVTGRGMLRTGVQPPPKVNQNGTTQVHLDQLTADDLDALGRIRIALNANYGFTGRTFLYDGDRPTIKYGGSPEVQGGIANAPIVKAIQEGKGSPGTPTFVPGVNATGAEIEAALNEFLDTGKRSVVSDALVAHARTGGIAGEANVPAGWGSEAAGVRKPVVGEPPPSIEGRQMPLPPPGGEEVLPDWVTDQTVEEGPIDPIAAREALSDLEGRLLTGGEPNEEPGIVERARRGITAAVGKGKSFVRARMNAHDRQRPDLTMMDMRHFSDTDLEAWHRELEEYKYTGRQTDAMNRLRKLADLDVIEAEQLSRSHPGMDPVTMDRLRNPDRYRLTPGEKLRAEGKSWAESTRADLEESSQQLIDSTNALADRMRRLDQVLQHARELREKLRKKDDDERGMVDFRGIPPAAAEKAKRLYLERGQRDSVVGMARALKDAGHDFGPMKTRAQRAAANKMVDRLVAEAESERSPAPPPRVKNLPDLPTEPPADGQLPAAARVASEPRAADGPARVAQLERTYGDDAAFGVHADPETEESRLYDEERSAVNCTNYAECVLEAEGAGKILGYAHEDNPTATLGEDEGGHDFALVDGRYLVDPWAKLVTVSTDRVSYDLQNPQDVARVRSLYGDPAKWSERTESGDGWQAFDGTRLLSDVPRGTQAAEQPSLPGAEGVRETENPTPAEPLPFTLERERGAPPKAPTQETLFGDNPNAPDVPGSLKGLSPEEQARRLAARREQGGLFGGEEGVLVLGVPPGDTKGLVKWLKQTRKDHGHESWHKDATQAIAEGDPTKAWRIAMLAAAKTQMRTLADADREKPAGAPISGRGSYLKNPPPGVTVGAGGVLQPPKGAKQLAPEHTDLSLARAFVPDILATTDPSQIVRIPGNTESEMRLYSQIADQIIRDVDPSALKALTKVLGLGGTEKGRLALATHFKRKVRRAAQLLRSLKDYQDEFADQITVLNPILGGSGVGEAPPKVDLTPGQKAAAKRRAYAIKAAADTLDSLASSDHWIDRRMAAYALERSHSGRELDDPFTALENLSRAIIVSKSSTAIRNLWTQIGRYSVGVADDVATSAFVAMKGDLKGAGRYLTRAKNLVQSATRPGAGAVHPWQSTMQGIYDYTVESLKNLPAKDIRRTLAILDKFPKHSADFLGQMSLETGAQGAGAKGLGRIIRDPNVRNMITVLNRLQEYSIRSTVFDALFRTALENKGIDPNRLLTEDFKTIANRIGPGELDEMVSLATTGALEFTFASNPYPGSIPQLLLRTFSQIPVLSTVARLGYPFPRFNFVSAPRFLYDHSPAALMDLPLAAISMAFKRQDPALFSGRLYKGIQAAKMQREFLPKMAVLLQQAKLQEGVALQDYLANKVAASKAAKAFKKLEARAARQQSLEGMQEELARVGADLKERTEQGPVLRQAYKDAQRRSREVNRQQAQMRERLRHIKAIGAPSLPEYFGRQATGAALFAAALYLRASDQADGTDWYEYKVHMPGMPGVGPGHDAKIDMRPFAPFVQYLLPADLLVDMHRHTDWAKVGPAVPEENRHNALAWVDAMRANYHGKYTNEKARVELVNGFLSLSQAAGATLTLSDLLAGKGTSQGVINDTYNAILGTAGQFLGRFTVPLQMISELRGQAVDPEAAKARIPEGPVPGDHRSFDLLFGPTIANMPGMREDLIPPTVSPITGHALQTMDPAARTLAGLTQRERNWVDEEMTRVGLPMYQVVPRATGDRDFDNLVAEKYAEGAQRFLPFLMKHPLYQKMNPELKRDVLASVMRDIKGYAYTKMASAIGGKALLQKIERPQQVEKRNEWLGFLQQLRDELQQETPREPQVGPPPAVPSPRVGTPPPRLPR